MKMCKEQLNLLEQLIKSPQHKLKELLTNNLQARGYTVRNEDGFLYAKGNYPVLLVAHMDTVHQNPVKTICKSPDQVVWMSPQGIGGDDRAGIFIILELLEQFPCSVLFCEDEEIGCVGAELFIESGINISVNYIVEFDRRGSRDAVFYNCANKDFTKFILDFGFQEKQGSFSDISVIAPFLKTAAVNISAGYYNAHTIGEYICINDIENIIKLSSDLLSAKSKKYKYVKRSRPSFRSRYDIYKHYVYDPLYASSDSFDDLNMFDKLKDNIDKKK